MAINFDHQRDRISSSTGIITVNTTGAIVVPVGNIAQRPTAVTGQLRFNTENQSFEGYNGAAWGFLGGVKDVDGNTYIIAETSSGANNNDLDFYTNGGHRLQIDENGDFRFGASLNKFVITSSSGDTAIAGTLGVTGQTTLASASVTDLTANRVVYAGASGELQDNTSLTFDGSTLTLTGTENIVGQLNIDNIRIDGSSITSTNTNGNINITPNGTGDIIASTLKVSDLTNNRLVIVGVDGELEDDADLTFDATTFIIGANKFTVNATSGNTVIAGALDVTGSLGVDGSFDVATNKFTVNATSGNTVVAGTLDVTGATGIDGNFDIATNKFTVNATSGNTVVAGTLDVTGATGIDGNFDIATNKFTVNATSGNTVVAGTLDVTGATGIDGNFDIATNKFTVNATSGDTAIAGTLGVTGQTTLASASVTDLTANRVVYAGASGELQDSLNLTFDGSTLALTGALTVSTNLTINSTTAISSILDEDTMSSNSATALATQQSIKAYVDNSNTAQALSIAGTIGSGTVNLSTQTLTIAGTANEIETSATNQTITIGLPNDITIAGNLTVNGTTTTVNSTVTTIDDPVITLGGDTAPSVDDNKDRGIEFRWHNGSTDKIGFFGFDDSTGKFTFIPDATNTSEVFSGTKGTLDANIEWTDILSKPDPTITLAGDLTGSVTLTDLASGTLTATIAANSVELGTDTTGDYVASVSVTSGTGISVTGTGEGAAVTVSGIDATSSVKGVASFNSTDFTVSSGAVSINSESIQDIVGAMVSSNSESGITVTYDDTNGKLDFSVATQTLSFTIAGDSGTDSFSTGGTLTFTGTDAIDTSITNDTVTISIKDATTAQKGAASFSSSTFSVTSGAVDVKSGGISNSQLVNSSVTIGSTSVSLGSTVTAFTGITDFTVDNININGNEITSTDTNGNISLNPNGTGVVDVNNSRITGLATPTQASDAVTKDYVDALSEGLHVHASCDAATTDTLAALTGGTVTYDNGTSGVNATLTLSVALTAVDSYNLQNNDRLLVKNEANTAHNGIYTWATGGTVLTRATDFDTAAEIAGGDFTFVTNGTSYNNTGWVETETVTNVGSDSIIFVQFSGAGTFVAGDGLSLAGNTFAVNVSATGGIEISADALQLKSTVSGNGLTLTNGVLDVGGTADRITVSANAVDIASTYVGQSSISTVGTVTSGTWSASFGAVSGANLTNLTAGNLTGTIPSAVLGNSSLFVGTTSVALNRASANLGLTGITSIAMPGATSGTITITPDATAGSTSITIPATTGTLITTGDTGTVTSTMIADGTIVNDDINASAAIVDTKLATISTVGKVSNSATTATSTNTNNAIVTRDSSGNFSAGTITAALTGNASTATTLETTRTLWGQNFNGGSSVSGNLTSVGDITGSSAITITAGGSNQNITLTPSGTGYTLLNGNVGINIATPAEKLHVDGAIRIDSTYNLDSATATIASTSQTAIASFSSTTFGGGKVVIQSRDTITGARSITEMLIVHDGTTASATQYAMVNTGANDLAAYDVDINSGNVRILATQVSTNSTQYKVVQTLLLA